MVRFGALLTIFLLLCLQAAIVFPELSGRVVDEASLLSPSQRTALSAELAALEKATTDQLVVVTLKSLHGYDISDYGYQLGRHWGIGQKGKDNGVLLIVAPNERKVRIEVGYGLEGVLTDYTSKMIIENRILPAFKKGDYARGIETGAKAIIAQLRDPAHAPDLGAEKSGENVSNDFQYTLALIFIIIAIIVSTVINAEGNALRSAMISFFSAAILYALIQDIFSSLFVFVFIFVLAYSSKTASYSGFGSGGGGGGGGSFGGGGGGFSGGGGSFGGGGASGDW